MLTKAEKAECDRAFRKLCRWFAEAAEIAEIFADENRHLGAAMTRADAATEDEKALHSAYTLLLFLSALYEAPQDYEGEPESQRDDYPGAAYGLMTLARSAGLMKLNDGLSPMEWS